MGELEKLNSIVSEMTSLIRNANREGTPASPQEVQEALRVMLREQGLRPQYSTVQEVIERIRQIESDPGAVVGTIAAIGQGMSFGFADEIAGLLGGEDAREEQRRIMRASRSERPALTLAAEIAGGLVAPGLSSISAVKTTGSLGKAMLTGLAVGALEGAVVGYGEAEGSPLSAERATGAGMGAAFGALMGPAAAGLQRSGTYILRKFTGKTAQTVEEQARDVAQRYVKQSPRGIEGVLEDFENLIARKPEALPADVPELRGLTRQAAAVSPQTRAVAHEILLPRQQAARRRVEQDLLRSVNMNSPPSRLAKAAEFQARRALGSAAYEDLARTVTEVDDPILNELLDLPHVRDTFLDAVKFAEGIGEKLTPIYEQIDGVWQRTGTMPDFRSLQTVRGALYDEVGALYKSGAPGKANKLKEVAHNFSERMRDVISGYSDQQRNWMTLMREQEALEEGIQFMRHSPDEIARNMERFTDTALTSYREGAVHSIIGRLENQVRQGGNVARQFDTGAMENKLRALFPSEEAFERFLDDLGAEELFAATTKRVAKGDELPEFSLVDLISAATGRRTLQRYSELPVIPLIAATRLAGEAQQKALDVTNLQRARRIADVWGGAMFRRPGTSGIDVRNLLTGAVGNPDLSSIDYALRTPRSALLGMLNRDREY